MVSIRHIAAVASIIGLLVSGSPVFAQTPEKPQGQQGFQVGKNPQVQQVKPKKPVRVKLHRNAKGEYTWDITGDNVDDVYQADRRLRKLLQVE
ncbi:MAG TPA: hypothetical protein VN260_04140 [Dissulfurispiraceae bacterium]|nr:hypothetical protein [Dissulfurispiraceae bacterium]